MFSVVKSCQNVFQSGWSFCIVTYNEWISLVTRWYRIHLPMQEIWAGSRSWGDPLEKETATHSSILAWEIPWTEEPGRLQSMGSRRIGHNDWTTTHNWFSDLSSHSFDIVFCRAEVFNFNEAQLINYFFYGSYLDDESKKNIIISKII